MSPNFRVHGDSLAFDYEEFEKNSEYLEAMAGGAQGANEKSEGRVKGESG